MPRHPPPPFRKRRVFLLCAASVVLVLGGALWSAAQKRRQLIHQRMAWRIPYGSDQSGATLTLSPDGKQLRYCFASKHVNQNDRVRIFDTRTGDVLGDDVVPLSPGRSPSLASAQVTSEERQGILAWLPNSRNEEDQNVHLTRRGGNSLVLKTPGGFSRTNALYELHLSQDGSLLTMLSQRGLWQVDVKSQRVLRVVRPVDTANGCWGMTWDDDFSEHCTLSPDGRFIVTLAPRPTLYDAVTGRKIRSVGQELETQCGGCGCIEPQTGFSPNGKLMWASEDEMGGGNLAFWRMSDGKKVWQHVLSHWDFDCSGKYVISPGDGLVLNAATGQTVCHMKSSDIFDVYTVSPDGRQLYTLPEGERIYHYRLP